ncbi:MAG TPA: hypothetical protein VJN18_34040 [Polyangiaceae bacterium]|nr:hypothetical protein [Polyangiaceae bacterium]
MRAALVRPRAFALVFLLAGCGARSPLEAGELGLGDEPDPTPKPGPVPEPEPEPEPEPVDYVRVAGCVSLCQGGCAFPGRVFGTRLDTGEVVFPMPLPSGTSGRCSAELPRGASLRVEAQINAGFRFLWWENAGNDMWAPCPYSGSVEPTFELVVEEPVYCGAVFAKK